MNSSGMFERDLWVIPNVNIDNIRSFPLHYHRHIEFVFIRDGFAEMEVNGTRYTLKKGDAVFATPYMLHSYIKHGECQRCIVVSEPEAFGFLGTFLEKNHPASPLIKAEQLSRTIPDINQKLYNAYKLCHMKPPHQSEYDIRMSALLYEIFSGICVSEEFVSSEHMNDSLYLSALKLCCDNFTDENFDIQKLIAELSVSASTLQKLFAKNLGMGVKEYINYLRIGNAKSLLVSTGVPISEIAFSCGFSTIRSFNRAFLKFNGMSPTELRIQSEDSIRR